jgi:mannose-6-phosphate isomerase
MNTPLEFRPYLRPMVWGGRRLGEALGKPLPTAAAYGESWEISDHPSHRSVVVGGPHAGRTLRDLMQGERAALLGAAAETTPTFPWLVKFLDAWDWLSVQVHPDERAVRELWPGEGSKTEAWFILDAAPGSRVWAGLRPGVGERELRAALAAGAAAECLHTFEPRPGDCLFLPAGTVHAVGGGVLMAEVQQTSDATFRLYDWDRVDAHGQRRELHVEQALACIDWRAGPVRPVRAEGYPDGATPARQRLVNCRYFTLDYVRQSEPFACGGAGRMQVLIALHGRGAIETADGPLALAAGRTLLLPAALPEVTCVPDGPLGLLVSTLPQKDEG